MSICVNCRNRMSVCSKELEADRYNGCNWKMKDHRTNMEFPRGLITKDGTVSFGWIKSVGAGMVNDQLIVRDVIACGNYNKACP